MLFLASCVPKLWKMVCGQDPADGRNQNAFVVSAFDVTRVKEAELQLLQMQTALQQCGPFLGHCLSTGPALPSPAIEPYAMPPACHPHWVSVVPGVSCQALRKANIGSCP